MGHIFKIHRENKLLGFYGNEKAGSTKGLKGGKYVSNKESNIS